MKTVFNALNFNSWVGEPKLSFGLYRNSIAKIWGKIKVFGLRCCISPQWFLFTNRVWPLSNVHPSGGYCKSEEAKPTSLLSPLNSTQAAISMKRQQARCVAPGVKGRWNRQGETLVFVVLVAVLVVDRMHSRAHLCDHSAAGPSSEAAGLGALRPPQGLPLAAGPGRLWHSSPQHSPAAPHPPPHRNGSLAGQNRCFDNTDGKLKAAQIRRCILRIYHAQIFFVSVPTQRHQDPQTWGFSSTNTVLLPIHVSCVWTFLKHCFGSFLSS